MSKILNKGDTVLWRHGWGRDPEKEAVVTSIQINDMNGSKHGTQVDAVSWDTVTERNVIVDLDTGHWAWAFQIARATENKPKERKQLELDFQGGES